MYTYKDIVESLPTKKNSKSSLWVKFIIRKLSFIFTYLFINLGFSAKQVSLLSVIVAVAGCSLLMIKKYYIMILGMILINLWLVLDCVDGNIARCKKTSSPMGEFVDALSGYMILAFVYLAIGVAAYNTTDSILESNKYILIIIGAITSIADILSRLIHQKYTFTLYTINKYKDNDKVENKKSLSYIRSRIDKEIGISGAFMPLLIVSTILNNYIPILIFYMIFNLVGLLGVIILYTKRA